MGRVSAEDWEHVVTRDLLPFLGFGIDLKPRGAQFPVGSTGLPDGAYEDLSADVGRLGAEGLLVVPPPPGWWIGCGTGAYVCRSDRTTTESP
jgi:hypothetical protein